MAKAHEGSSAGASLSWFHTKLYCTEIQRHNAWILALVQRSIVQERIIHTHNIRTIATHIHMKGNTYHCCWDSKEELGGIRLIRYRRDNLPSPPASSSSVLLCFRS